MNAIYKSFNRRIEYFVYGNADLLGLWIVLIAIQPLVPVGNLLAREDLVPWLMLCLGLTPFFFDSTACGFIGFLSAFIHGFLSALLYVLV